MLNKDVVISYVKTNDFRTTFVNGVYGGVSTSGLISANFFVERIPIPESETVLVDMDTKKMVGEPKPIKKADVVREVQTGFLLDVNTAEVIIKWLQEKIVELKKLRNEF
jgi:hypothetical protein